MSRCFYLIVQFAVGESPGVGLRRFQPKGYHTAERQEITALRDFDPACDRYGSVASHPDVRDAPGMSAMPPIDGVIGLPAFG